MAKVGAIQDLVRGVEKIISSSKNKNIKETAILANDTANVQSLLKRANIFLKDGNYKSASEYFDRVLDIEPENSEANLNRLLSELKIKSIDEIESLQTPPSMAS